MTGIPKAPEAAEIIALKESETLFPSLSLSGENEDIPDLSDVPLYAQHILCLLACGWSQKSVAHTVKCEPQTISYYVSRYDPKRAFVLSKEGRRAFLSRLWEARAGEALMAITPQKLDLSSAVDLSNIARRSVSAFTELDAVTTPTKGADDVKDLVAQLIEAVEEEEPVSTENQSSVQGSQTSQDSPPC